ncbi:transcription regulator HTH, apses-type DNA-binding domain-containing protein [Zychaea mexicana]|uniref:transcription regulator HTH, apses-type DNA-binding domain-containing protein n=1 Tax=Zychaea mexicana TaxID=64656 RepID=UPI0022FEB8B6|nr:transcription regulator HTH, apses-type DNA-binding domain-containing protein [Zychaea mexicana]KAI9492881.1 transcription regulator HTH, apses-type DNA-binding domain-containing protein [Zychaea mexicana]
MSNQARHHHHHHHHHPISPPGFGPPASLARPKLTTTVWEDEGTVCYQVDAKGICVARRADKEMINGTKLLNVVGMSRGKRDGILKNEKDRVVIKVGAMHLKGVWITLRRAKYLATKFRICDLLYPLFEDDPKKYVYATSPPGHPASAAAAAAAAAAIAAGVSSPPASVASSRRASSLLDNSPDSLSSGIRSSSFNDNTKRSSLPSMSALDQGMYSTHYML